MTILSVNLDYDGCFAGEVQYENKNFYISGPITRHIASLIAKHQYKTVYLGTFSNRQDVTADHLNSFRHKSLSSFQALEALLATLQKQFPKVKFYLDRFLLADTAANVRSGTTWRAALQHMETNPQPLKFGQIAKLPKPLSQEIKVSKLKLDLFYIKAHRIAKTVGSNTHVHSVIYEDSEDILEGIHKNYSSPDYSNLLPSNFSCEVFAYTALSDEQYEDYIKQTPETIYHEVASTYDKPIKIPLFFGRLHPVPSQCEDRSRAQVLPGVVSGAPEMYPYRDKTSLGCFYTKKNSVLKEDVEFNIPSYTIIGKGKINPDAEKANFYLSQNFHDETAWSSAELQSLETLLNTLRKFHNQRTVTWRSSMASFTFINPDILKNLRKMALNSLTGNIPSIPKLCFPRYFRSFN